MLSRTHVSLSRYWPSGFEGALLGNSSSIRGAEVEGRSIKDPLAGGMRRRLAFVTQTETDKYVVNNASDVASAVCEAAGIEINDTDAG